ncbi:MAG: ribosome recycling factor [Planctomycetes bacterium]|nr:ribosome recycling factor [Planctomycetota bacterium]
MPETLVLETEEIMEKAIAALEREFKRLRSGRATPDMVEHIRVDYYGSETPLAQVANISAPEPRLLVIKAFDNSVLAEIEKAIVRSNMGINPQNDGKMIRLNVPPLTEETRKKLVQDTKKALEHGRVSVRNARRDANKKVETFCKDKLISEDQRDSMKGEVQDLTSKFEDKLQTLQKDKEKELLTV